LKKNEAWHLKQNGGIPVTLVGISASCKGWKLLNTQKRKSVTNRFGWKVNVINITKLLT